MRVLVRELAQLYEAFATGQVASLPDLPLTYRDFTVSQRRAQQSVKVAQDLDYWKARLNSAPAALELPTDRPRSALRTSRGARLPFRLSPAVVEALGGLSRHQGCTPFMV